MLANRKARDAVMRRGLFICGSYVKIFNYGIDLV